jgi:endonuclease/exonuclease/phosphatase family metal-dependent hydrolase
MAVRIASFNVENLFQRARALDLGSWVAGRPILEAHAQLNTLFAEEVYTPARKERILDLLGQLGLLHADLAEFAILRVIRGRLVVRHRDGTVEVVADGRSDWVGWVDLTREPADELALRHTAMVVRDVAADILGVVEAEDRTTLQRFNDQLLRDVGGTPYEQVMLVDGNDDRGIDVGIFVRAPLTIDHIRTHVFDVDEDGVVFSRDCCEYHLTGPGGPLVVLVNHFKSKGYSEPGDRLGAARRRRQATRVAEIYRGLRVGGADRIAVVGDFNDSMDSAPLAPLLQDTDLRDISAHGAFEPGPRQGTFQGGNKASKFDDVLLSPAVFGAATGGAIFRRGVWHGPRVSNPWEMYPTLTAEVHAASDHAAIYADVAI